MDLGKSRRVAIMDDDAGVLRALGRLVRSLGFHTDIYPSGEALLASPDAAQPDHALLDLRLPGLRGPGLIAAIRESLADARGLVMTGLDHPGARDACLTAGETAYLIKPIRREDLGSLLALSG